MRKETLIVGFFFVILCGLLIVFAPDGLSMVFVIGQAVLMLLGFIFGIYKVSKYSGAFQYARHNLYQTMKEIQSDDLWLPVSKNESLFQYAPLDRDFAEYKNYVVERQKKDTGILPDIEEVINEDMLSIKTWRNIVNQIPETLTGIGILGTFVGLIIGVGSIGFSSVQAAVTSLQTLINGIEIAFYTSIVGIILSILFNLIYKFYWNLMLRDMFIFIDDFHKNVIASEEDQMRDLESKFYVTMLRNFDDK